MDVAEYTIDGSVTVPEFPPSFDNTCVVAMDEEVAAKARDRGESIDEELKANGFCPSDVTFAIEGLPARDKPPGTPMVSNDNAYAYT
jgi:hypothetical protein